MNEVLLDHERHDPLLIAGHAAGDLTGRDADTAVALVRDCPACATLETDLRALATTVHDLPASARPRDFRLTPADAAKLRRDGWRRVRDVVRGDAFRLARPVGAGLASLGFAGLVFASTIGAEAPVTPGSSSTGAGILEEVGPARDTAGAAENGGTQADGGFSSPATLDAQQVTGERGAVDPDAEEPTDTAAGQTAAAAEPNEAIIVVSGSLFIVGIGLFGARWTSDRLGDG